MDLPRPPGLKKKDQKRSLNLSVTTPIIATITLFCDDDYVSLAKGQISRLNKDRLMNDEART